MTRTGDRLVARGLWAAPLFLAAPFLLPVPDGLSPEGWAAAWLGLLMALWWLTGALPLAATALLPLALGPLMGLAPLDQIARAYAHPLIVLFLGGFILARAIEAHGIHRRRALTLLSVAGDRPGRVLAAVMAATAFLSLWISNTAAAMVMAPLAAAVAGDQRSGFATAVMLGTAFAATIGGMGSLIGTPPNAIFAAYVGESLGRDIGFAEWAAVGMPVAAVLLAACWLVLARLTPGLDDAPAARPVLPQGPLGKAGMRVALIAALTAALWIARPLIDRAVPGLGLTDAGIAMLAVLALFALPSGQGGRLVDWNTAAGIRWDVLILVGGGLALAGLIDATGLGSWIGGRMAALDALPLPVLAFLIAAVIVYVGELASNTAMAAVFLPVAAASAIAIGADPLALMWPVALAASIGFMLPVATPPNAIVFGHPAVGRAAMLKAGAILDVLGLVVAVGLATLLGPLVL